MPRPVTLYETTQDFIRGVKSYAPRSESSSDISLEREKSCDRILTERASCFMVIRLMQTLTLSNQPKLRACEARRYCGHRLPAPDQEQVT